MKRIKDYSLYLVTGENRDSPQKWGQSLFSTLAIAKLAIAGGIDILQMREKEKSREELVKLGMELAALCEKRGVIFIVNDDPLLAKEVNADGVHLGQEDVIKYSPEETRKILGEDRMIGISTHTLGQFERANAGDFDYISFGPIFRTETKDYFIGTEDISKVLAVSSKPVVFIGGINTGNIDAVLEKGAKNIAVIRAITRAEDITQAVKGLKKRLKLADETEGGTGAL